VSALFNTSYLPSFEYLKMVSVNSSVCFDEEDTWKKKTVRNRTFILSPNGIQCLSVPVIAKQHVTLTNDCKIDNSQSWTRVHKGALEAAFNTAPFFEFIKDDLWPIYDKKPTFLVDLNQMLLALMIKKLKIKTSINSDKKSPDILHDFRKLSDNHSYSPVLIKEAELHKYNQVFSYKHPFVPNLSALDFLANCGSLTSDW